MTHTHKATMTWLTPYDGPVTESQTPNAKKAQGNICKNERCACGAIRRTNINGRFSDSTGWRNSEPGDE